MAEIIWRRIAQKQRIKILQYGEKAFGKQATLKLYNTIKHCEDLLAVNPYMGVTEILLASKRLNYRSLVVHHHYKLVYYINVKQETIYIAALWDTRREPQSLAENIQNK